jgi:hypothetical protein
MLAFHSTLRGAGSVRWMRPIRSLLALSAISAALVACGGGGGAAVDVPPPPAATTSFTAGAISGFGSIIVNGVRFDDSGAEVLDDDGHRHGRDDLKLGAQVEIDASSIDRSGGHGVATRIRFGSEIVGPVESVDVAGQRLTVLGQAVEVSARTVFDDSLAGGLAGVGIGAVLEVHAQFDAARSVYVATRIEGESSPASYKLRGPVASLDTTAKTFLLGSAVVNYAGTSDVTAQLADGARVRVRLQTTPVNDQWIATQVSNGERHVEDHGEAEVKGLITAWTSATLFSVDGLPVDASNASFRDGQAGVVLGARVEVEGQVVNGVLVASKVHLEDDSDDSHSEDYELHGTVSALDTSARTFALRGLTVSYSGSVTWRDLSEADLADGLTLEVKGHLSADGTRLEATRISRED